MLVLESGGAPYRFSVVLFWEREVRLALGGERRHPQREVDRAQAVQGARLRQGVARGLGMTPLALYALADRLPQPVGNWEPFEKAIGWRRHVYD